MAPLIASHVAALSKRPTVRATRNQKRSYGFLVVISALIGLISTLAAFLASSLAFQVTSDRQNYVHMTPTSSTTGARGSSMLGGSIGEHPQRVRSLDLLREALPSGKVLLSNVSKSAEAEGKYFLTLKIDSLDVNATWARICEHAGTADCHFQLTLGTVAARYSHYTSGGPGWTVAHRRFELLTNRRTKYTLIYKVDNPTAIDTDSVAEPTGQLRRDFDQALKPIGVKAADLIDIFAPHLDKENIVLWNDFKEAFKKYA